MKLDSDVLLWSSAEFLVRVTVIAAPPPHSAMLMVCKGDLVLYQNQPTHFLGQGLQFSAYKATVNALATSY